MTAGSSDPTRYRAHQRSETYVLHSQAEPPIILSCSYVSECPIEHDHILPWASFAL